MQDIRTVPILHKTRPIGTGMMESKGLEPSTY